MKLVIADCSAIYLGRGETRLPSGIRTLMIKADGSISIHNDMSNKPLNYMKSAEFAETTNSENEPVWIYESNDERLSITIHSIIASIEEDLIQDDPGVDRKGTEKHLQEWLMNHPEVLGDGFTVVGQEYQTGEGPVDLLVLDADKNPVAVEIKRVATPGAVDQCRRYKEALQGTKTKAELAAEGLFSKALDTSTNVENEIAEYPEADEIDFSKTTGMVAAIVFKPKVAPKALKQKIATVSIPVDWQLIP